MTGIELEAALTAFPRSRLCDFATPVHRLPRLERKLNTCPLYIKRDDLNGVGSGGNKVRPLEYLLGEAQAQGCDVVIASGQENSNLCSIAASACCRLGLKCILVHNNDQPRALRATSCSTSSPAWRSTMWAPSRKRNAMSMWRS